MIFYYFIYHVPITNHLIAGVGVRSKMSSEARATLKLFFFFLKIII